MPECETLQELFIANNFSESTAALDLKAGTQSTRTLLSPFFESQMVDEVHTADTTTTPVKLRRLGSRRAIATDHPMAKLKTQTTKTEDEHPASDSLGQQLASPVQARDPEAAEMATEDESGAASIAAMQVALATYGEGDHAVPTSSDDDA